MTRQNPSPEQIEHEISATRADIDETLDALQNKLSPGELLDQALSYAKDGGGEFAANFGRTVRDNPVPVALLGVGIGWLMVSGRSEPEVDRREPAHGYEPRPADPLESAYGAAGVPGAGPSGHAQYASAPHGPAGGAAPQASTATSAGRTSKAGDDGGSVRSKVGDTASDLASDAKARIDEAGERIGELRDEAGERIGELRDEVADRAASARRKTGDYARRARHTISQAKDSAGRYYHENPLVVGALALGAGAALGALLPSTKREDELLGEHSEAVKSTAEDTLAESVEKAKTVAATAVEKGKEEAQRQRTSSAGGLSTGSPGRSASARTTRPARDEPEKSGPGQNLPPGAKAAGTFEGGKGVEETEPTRPKRRQSQ